MVHVIYKKAYGTNWEMVKPSPGQADEISHPQAIYNKCRDDYYVYNVPQTVSYHHPLSSAYQMWLVASLTPPPSLTIVHLSRTSDCIISLSSIINMWNVAPPPYPRIVYVYPVPQTVSYHCLLSLTCRMWLSASSPLSYPLPHYCTHLSRTSDCIISSSSIISISNVAFGYTSPPLLSLYPPPPTPCTSDCIISSSSIISISNVAFGFIVSSSSSSESAFFFFFFSYRGNQNLDTYKWHWLYNAYLQIQCSIAYIQKRMYRYRTNLYNLI